MLSLIPFPHESEMDDLSEQERTRFCVVLAGGIAGELSATGTYDLTNDDPYSTDNATLSRFSDKGLTEFLSKAAEIIYDNRPAFRQLCSRIEAHYPLVQAHISIFKTGIFILVSKKELDEILVALK